MLRKCDIQDCAKPAIHQIKVGDATWAFCSTCAISMYELGRQFDDDISNLKRKYFRLITEHRKEN